jgi:hypothetical protein
MSGLYKIDYRTAEGEEKNVSCKPREIQYWEKYIRTINAEVTRRQWLPSAASR